MTTNSQLIPTLIQCPNILHPFWDILPELGCCFDFAVFLEFLYDVNESKLLVQRPFTCIIIMRYVVRKITVHTLTLRIAMYQMSLVSVATGGGWTEHVITDFGPSPTLLKEPMIIVSSDRWFCRCRLLTTSVLSHRHPSLVPHPDRDHLLAECGCIPTALTDLAPHVLGHGVNTTI